MQWHTRLIFCLLVPASLESTSWDHEGSEREVPGLVNSVRFMLTSWQIPVPWVSAVLVLAKAKAVWELCNFHRTHNPARMSKPGKGTCLPIPELLPSASATLEGQTLLVTLGAVRVHAVKEGVTRGPLLMGSWS